MKKLLNAVCLMTFCLIGATQLRAQTRGNALTGEQMKQAFLHPPEAAKPWIFWYWMQASVTREGIKADLEAMKYEGIGGAYLMPIKGPANLPYLNPPVNQLTPEWWAMVKYAMQEAGRLGLKIAMHDCDGFAVAGGPWITPEMSMQKVVWTKTLVAGGKAFNDTLARPESYKGFYKDIKILAYPSPEGSGITTEKVIPKVTASTGADLQYLAEAGNKKSFAASEPCWIQLAFDKPFTCRSLVVKTTASNFQSERLIIEVSNNGTDFKRLTQLEPPRSGWQDGDAQITNDIVPTTARYFRFVYNKEGTEPGAEDIDFAKWKPSLKLSGIELSSEAMIHQFEGKNGEVWRVSKRTTVRQVPDELAVKKNGIIDITDKLDANGRLRWNIPAGNWTILRIGHTSTGHTNATGGAGAGLECDKFDPAAAEVQFDNWFGQISKQVGPDLTKEVLKIFHVDSWECGSQNWSTKFPEEFKKRRGYDLLPYLPVMAGIPVESAEVSEKVLSDVRQTIAELVVANFYGTMAKLAHAKGASFSAESVAPVFTSDGMLHQSQADIPMGEFWLRSPSHDKPSDMADAISAGHIYGKNIIQAEAFTELRMMWDEYPGMLKTMADRNFAAGINRYVFHVDVLNPWLDRKPGMTLDGIGTFLQRDQTWWKQGDAWMKYIARCQALLQMGKPVVDIAVFTGEETPRRAILPDRLVNTLPGLFGKERLEEENIRLANKGVPMRVIPDGVSNTANSADPDKWVDPLHGYAYDSINLDALLRLATVKDGRIVLPGGARYSVLVIPGSHPMSPDSSVMSVAAIKKIKQLADKGAKIIFDAKPNKTPGLSDDKPVQAVAAQLSANKNILKGAYRNADLNTIRVSKDIILTDSTGNYAPDIAWNHRKGDGFDIYFLANQHAQARTINVSLRATGKTPELWDALTGETRYASDWKPVNGRTELSIKLESNGSVFIVLKSASNIAKNKTKNWASASTVSVLKNDWSVKFDEHYGGPSKPVKFTSLIDWSKNEDAAIKYYSGTASYSQTINWQQKGKNENIWLDLGTVNNVADVYVNGVRSGTAWTYPYRVNISKALKEGANDIRIEVSNTWANRLIGDHALPENQRTTWTNAVYRLENKPLLPAGLMGLVKILKLKY